MINEPFLPVIDAGCFVGVDKNITNCYCFSSSQAISWPQLHALPLKLKKKLKPLANGVGKYFLGKNRPNHLFIGLAQRGIGMDG
mgnify:CR=1 FL=1